MSVFSFNIQIVNEYERAVIFRVGRIVGKKPKGPGLSFNALHELSTL